MKKPKKPKPDPDAVYTEGGDPLDVIAARIARLVGPHAMGEKLPDTEESRDALKKMRGA